MEQPPPDSRSREGLLVERSLTPLVLGIVGWAAILRRAGQETLGIGVLLCVVATILTLSANPGTPDG